MRLDSIAVSRLFPKQRIVASFLVSLCLLLTIPQSVLAHADEVISERP